MYKRQGRQITPLMAGGGQERNLRSGTENLPAIAAMAKALRLLLDGEDAKVKRQREIRLAILHHVAAFPNVTIFSKDLPVFAPHILCFAIAGVRGETVVHAFEEHDIYISTTSACSSKKHVESSTLQAMKIDDGIATSAVRISLDEHNTMAEAEEFNRVFDELYTQFEKLA